MPRNEKEKRDPGRPKVIKNPVKSAFWLDREVLDQANEAARAQGTTVSEVVRKAIARLARSGRRPRPRRSKTSRSS